MSVAEVADWPRPPRFSGVTNWSAVRGTNPELVDRLAVNMYRCDDIADRAVAALLETRGGWRSLDTLLGDVHRRLDSAPAELQEMLAPLIDPPRWYEPDLVDSGARTWWRFGSVQAITLYQSLLYGYQSPGLSRPLARTGRLMSGTSDRLAETGRWITHATAPGGMAPGAPGWIETIRIRLLHAMIRRHLLMDDWDVDGWGIPINHTYSAFTISGGFLVLPLIVARDLGIRYSSAEYEAITQQWRWIGYVIGVPEELLPTSYTVAREMFDVAAQFEILPDDDSRALTDALLHYGYSLERLPKPMERVARKLVAPILASSFGSISTRWVPPNAAKGMGLRRNPLHHAVDIVRPVVRMREAARAIGLLGKEDAVARRELRFVLANLDRFSTKRASLRPEEAA